jgi:hypothetical protein
MGAAGRYHVCQTNGPVSHPLNASPTTPNTPPTTATGSPGARRARLAVLAVVAIALFSAAVAIAGLNSASSTAHTVASGGLAFTNNSDATAMISLTNALGSASSTGCIKITNSGTVKAVVHLYATVAGTLAPYLTLVVTRGTDSSPSYKSCTNFTADATNYIGSGAGVVSSGLLSAYPTTYAAGVVDVPTGAATWAVNEAHSYKLAITLANNSAAETLTSTATFIWGSNSVSAGNK